MVFIARSNSMDLEGNTTSNKFRLSLSNQITIGILRREERENRGRRKDCVSNLLVIICDGIWYVRIV